MVRSLVLTESNDTNDTQILAVKGTGTLSGNAIEAIKKSHRQVSESFSVCVNSRTHKHAKYRNKISQYCFKRMDAICRLLSILLIDIFSGSHIPLSCLCHLQWYSFSLACQISSFSSSWFGLFYIHCLFLFVFWFLFSLVRAHFARMHWTKYKLNVKIMIHG